MLSLDNYNIKDIYASTIEYLHMLLNSNLLELSEHRDVDSLIDWFKNNLK